MDELRADDLQAVDLVEAIRGGDVERLRRMLDAQPGLSSVAIRDGKGGVRTPLHVVADWPGYFPHGPAVVTTLGGQGADPNARGGSGETPLHWAASSDDVDVAAALLDVGADVDAPGGSIGTPLENAVGYGCWHVAALVALRGARIDTLWTAAALGRLADVERICAREPAPTQQQLDEAFWQACHGGRRRTAEYLLKLGANVDATQDHSDGTALDAARGAGTSRDLLATWLVERGAPTTGGRT